MAFWHPQRESNARFALRRGMLYPLNYGGIYEIYESYDFVGYPLFLHKKQRQGAMQGAKFPQALW